MHTTHKFAGVALPGVGPVRGGRGRPLTARASLAWARSNGLRQGSCIDLWGGRAGGWRGGVGSIDRSVEGRVGWMGVGNWDGIGLLACCLARLQLHLDRTTPPP